MSVDDAGGALVQRVESRIWLGLVAANLGGALIASLDGIFGSIIYPGGGPRSRLLFLLGAGAVGFYTVSVLASRRLIVRPTFRPAVAWLVENRAPTHDEDLTLIKQPARQATRFLSFWVLVAVVLYPYARFAVHYSPEPMAFVKAYVFIALSAFMAWTLSYLLVERIQRSLISHPLRHNRAVPTRMGILPRLLLGWGVVAGLPLASLAVEVIGLDAHQLTRSIPVFYTLAGTSVAIGIAAAWVGAYALTEPIGKLTAALRSVAAGDLDTEVTMDEAGQVGEVQAGFNQMVAGLRERRRIDDLFRRHVGDEVARYTMESGGDLGGERREVSVVFVDIIGSTGLAQRHGADDVVVVLNRFFDVAVEAITAQEGVVNKLEGDGVLGVFGAVAEQPDHAKRALRAARALRVELDALAPAMGAEAAIGVATGVAVAGYLGANDRYEYTVVGDPVDEAIRLCDEAKHTESKLSVSPTVTADARRASGHTAPSAAKPARIESPTSDVISTGNVTQRRLRLSIIRSLVIANALGSLYVAGNALLFHRIYPMGVSVTRFVTAIPVGYGVFMLSAVFAYMQGRRHLAPVEQWLAQDRPPTEREVAVLVGQPGKQAMVAMPYWGVAYVAVFLYQTQVLHYHPGAFAFVKEASAFVLGALIGATMSYLLVERDMRPILTVAFASGDTHAPLTLRTFPRLLLAWLVSSGAPIATLTLTISGLSETQRQLFVPIIYIGVFVAAAAGVFVTVVAARAVTDPLNDVMHGLRLIAGGDYDVVVPVNDGGELGLLEAETNRMARSLRERERLKQLFGRQVGAEVASRAIDVEAKLGGERRTVSAMFVRIVRTPVLSEDRSAEDVVAVFNNFFDAIVRAVGAEGGIVNKIKSDGALCIFGAPAERDDHALCALRSARALQRALATTGGIAAAIGVSTGDVVAGNVGAADRYEYTVIGDAVNEAARLTEHAKGANVGILVSEATIRAADADAAAWRPAGELNLRGRAEPTMAFAPAE